MYFSFGFEAINSAAHRELVMQRVMDWLLPTSVDVPGAAGAPDVTLVGNWPNPFNPRTEIVYRLAAEARVDLAVYDLQGRRVRTLAAETLPAGEHRSAWDGADDGGRTVAAGTYLYRLASGGEVQTGRMMIVK